MADHHNIPAAALQLLLEDELAGDPVLEAAAIVAERDLRRRQEEDEEEDRPRSPVRVRNAEAIVPLCSREDFRAPFRMHRESVEPTSPASTSPSTQPSSPVSQLPSPCMPPHSSLSRGTKRRRGAGDEETARELQLLRETARAREVALHAVTQNIVNEQKQAEQHNTQLLQTMEDILEEIQVSNTLLQDVVSLLKKTQ